MTRCTGVSLRTMTYLWHTCEFWLPVTIAIGGTCSTHVSWARYNLAFFGHTIIILDGNFLVQNFPRRRFFHLRMRAELLVLRRNSRTSNRKGMSEKSYVCVWMKIEFSEENCFRLPRPGLYINSWLLVNGIFKANEGICNNVFTEHHDSKYRHK